MNKPSSEIRSALSKEFDKGWHKKVGKTALLRDGEYFIPSPEDLIYKSDIARKKMADILEVSLDRLPNVHTRSNGRWDCDNFAILGCAILKALHEVSSRGKDSAEYAIWPMARADMDHTQAICLTDDGFYCVEFIDGSVWSIRDLKPEILMIG